MQLAAPHQVPGDVGRLFFPPPETLRYCKREYCNASQMRFFDLDLNQLTLTRYLGNRRDWDREHELKLELPDHYPVTEEVGYGSARSHGANLRQFMSWFKKIGRAHKDDFI